jgi:NAD(P)-dependent dehydrogenase (short-subunit alcohol dehydrogenase family)
VTGGTRGIGLACARELLNRGARVFIAAREREALMMALDSLGRSARPHQIDGVLADVSVPSSVDELFVRATHFGNLAGVIHAAGILGPIGTVVSVEPDAWLDAVRVNLFGTFLITRAGCKAMIAAGTGGSIVLLSGGGAATPFPNYTAYACAKVGVVRLAESVAIEVASSGVRVNALAPGFVATRLHQQTLDAGRDAAGEYFEMTRSRLAEGAVSADVAARAACFLISDQSRGITGRFLAAPYDDWQHWPEHLDAIANSDLFTLRRVVPGERDSRWK